ncbi:nucleotidyltransferase family protein [Polaribacter staleyi]|uniref:nucleotidyltransferase family protein n=1 Tax=Polaribacter staleyi TaxID=2022337 RepID=UPI0031BB8235
MMNYKETLFFVAKCLTINHEEKNKVLIEKVLKSGNTDWDSVVKVSTGHFVFPALYCNLKRANFLHYVPEELVNYMIHITDLNRERNQQIIDQAKEINELLLKNNITPIFLKGTGNLLEGLYEDIGERMVGDIDIILTKENVLEANKILQNNNYTSSSIMFDDHRHLPRLTKVNKIAAIELHKDFLEIPYRNNFNYSSIKDSVVTTEQNYSFLSAVDKMAMNIFSNQITDDGYEKASILLRNYYDFILLSQNCISNEVSIKYPEYKNIIISYWAVNSLLVKGNTTQEIPYNKIERKQINKVLWILNNPKLSSIYNKLKDLKIYLLTRSSIFIKAFYKKSNFMFVLSRVTSLEWYKRRIFRN